MPRFLACLFALALVACDRPEPDAPPDADESDARSPAALLAAMHDRYAGTRFQTLTFVQETMLYRPGGRVDSMTWYEAMVPGKLRIDVAPIEDGNGALYAHGRHYTFHDGVLVGSRPDVNTMAVLLSDVFTQPPARTVAVLDSLGFDLTKLREDTWKGVPVYVVGADSGDVRSPQFWVEHERLLAVRLIEPVGPDRSHTMDVHFNAYAPVGDAWIETEILIHVDSTLRQREHYTNIRPGVPLDSTLFDTTDWRVDRPYWQ